MISLRFYLVAPTRWAAVFFTSKNSVNRRSGFIALHFLEIMVGIGDIGLLSVNLSLMETIDS